MSDTLFGSDNSAGRRRAMLRTAMGPTIAAALADPELAAAGEEWLGWVLTGGEDHALLATFPGVAGRMEMVERREGEPRVIVDTQIVTDAEPFFKDGEKMQLSYAVQNTLRSIGTRVSSHIVKRFGMRNSL